MKAVNAGVFYHMMQGVLELTDKARILAATILVVGLQLFTAGGRSTKDLRTLRWALTEILNKARTRDAWHRVLPSGVGANSGGL